MKIKSLKTFKLSFALILMASFINSLKFESVSINLNQEIKGFSTQKHLSLYELQLDSDTQSKDLLIDSKTINSNTIYESPIVMISTVKNKKTFKNF